MDNNLIRIDAYDRVIGKAKYTTDLYDCNMLVGAVQFGFCTPGFIMSVTAMSESGTTYSEEEI